MWKKIVKFDKEFITCSVGPLVETYPHFYTCERWLILISCLMRQCSSCVLTEPCCMLELTIMMQPLPLWLQTFMSFVAFSFVRISHTSRRIILLVKSTGLECHCGVRSNEFEAFLRYQALLSCGRQSSTGTMKQSSKDHWTETWHLLMCFTSNLAWSCVSVNTLARCLHLANKLGLDIKYGSWQERWLSLPSKNLHRLWSWESFTAWDNVGWVSKWFLLLRVTQQSSNTTRTISLLATSCRTNLQAMQLEQNSHLVFDCHCSMMFAYSCSRSGTCFVPGNVPIWEHMYIYNFDYTAILFWHITCYLLASNLS